MARKPPAWFFAVPVLTVALAVEGLGHLGFRLKHGAWPREFARRHFDRPVK